MIAVAWNLSIFNYNFQTFSILSANPKIDAILEAGPPYFDVELTKETVAAAVGISMM